MKEKLNLKTENLSFTASEKNILENISFESDNNEFIGIVGPNGAGKSTLLKIISRNLKPTKGTIYVNKKEFEKYSRKEMSVLRSFVSSEEHISHDYLTVYNYICFGRVPYQNWLGTFSKKDHEIVEKYIDFTVIRNLIDKDYSVLSSGEKQRVQITRALVQEPALLLLDEPTSHLDINHQLEIMSLLKKISSSGVKIISILHDLNLAGHFCDRIILMSKGKIICFEKPGKAFTEENLEKVFGNSWQVTNDPFHNSPRVYPKFLNKLKTSYGIFNPARGGDGGGATESPQHPGLKSEVFYENKEKSMNSPVLDKKIHIIAGGGSVGESLKLIKEIGLNVSLGIVNILDSDYLTAKESDIEVITEEPFSNVKEETIKKLKEKINQADYIFITDLPFGEGNLVNLQEVLEAKNNGKTIVVENNDFTNRDFTGGKAEKLWNQLKPDFFSLKEFIDYQKKIREQKLIL